jgi:hypothetical protein
MTQRPEREKRAPVRGKNVGDDGNREEERRGSRAPL